VTSRGFTGAAEAWMLIVLTLPGEPLRHGTAFALRHLAHLGLALAVTGGSLTAATAPGAPLLAGVATPGITGGAPDGTTHPYVSMIVPPGGSRPTCTGVLVWADNGAAVVLTDAHCLYRNGQYTGTGVGVTFAADFSASAPRLAGRFSIDPLYNASTHSHDVAVIRLFTNPSVGRARLSALGAAASTVGTYVDTVGTGAPYSGHRRSATEFVTSASATWLYLRPGSGNSCGGDSGGPDLFRGSATVLALTNQGTCSYDQDTRLDTTIGSRSFIDYTAGLTRQRTTVQYGSYGTDVRVVQNLLGAYATSSFGSQTKTVVISWQRRHNLTPDGVVGPITWRSLGY